MKNKLMKKEGNVIRILEEKDDKVFIIDCIKKTMPYWCNLAELSDFEICYEKFEVRREELSAAEKRIMHERYTLIAGILPFVLDEKMRSMIISKISEQYSVSKQTIRKYLCLYLAYQDISVLAPDKKENTRDLTADEKNIRWAINKFFYTKNKNSLKSAYTMMLKEKYCDNLHKYWHYSNAYAEAMETMSVNDLYDKSNVAFYSDNQGVKTNYRFGLDEERRLSDAIKNGDVSVADEIIKDAIERITPENSFLYLNVSVGLIYSLMRIAYLLFGEAFDTRSLAFLLKNTDDPTVLLNECLESSRRMCEESKKNKADNKIAKKVNEYIRNNYNNSQLTAEIIASKMGYSFVHLNNLFKQEYSSTIVSYLNWYRIEKAKELIRLNISVNEVAKSVGILNLRTFHRQFQTFVGMTPTEYKNSDQKN